MPPWIPSRLYGRTFSINLGSTETPRWYAQLRLHFLCPREYHIGYAGQSQHGVGLNKGTALAGTVRAAPAMPPWVPPLPFGGRISAGVGSTGASRRHAQLEPPRNARLVPSWAVLGRSCTWMGSMGAPRGQAPFVLPVQRPHESHLGYVGAG